MNKQTGMSLIELMVAMGLGIFLIMGVVNVFIANKDSTQVETSLARLQENGRIALDMLVADIRDANYIGCSSADGAVTLMATGATWTGILGWERTAGAWSPALPAALNAIDGTNRVGSDVINIQHARNLNSGLTAPVIATTTALAIDNNPECIQVGEHVMISSCASAHLFEVTNAPTCNSGNTTFEFAAAGNAITSIRPDYTVAQASIMQTVDKTWYVRDTGRRRTGLNIPVYALFRRVAGQDIEMIEGVEYLQLNYGEQLGNGNIRYVPASDGNLDFNNDDIVSIRIALLIQSFEPVLDASDTAVYQVLDQAIDSTGTTFTHNGDRSLRRVFATTAVLRN